MTTLLDMYYRIGFAIAGRLAEDGASVMISSRKQQNVDRAVNSLKKKGLSVSGTVCHVANKQHRQDMIQKVRRNDPPQEKTRFLHMQKQRRRSVAR